MASYGEEAWKKYFQGKGDIVTKLKKDTTLYDTETQAKKIGTLKSGTEITFVKSSKFEKKALIKYKVGNVYKAARVPFGDIAKPNVKSSGAASLKPQAFGITEKQYSMREYTSTILSSIDSREDLTSDTKTYLHALFDYYSGGKTTKKKVTDIYKAVKTNIPVNDINKDFGEVIGPIAVFKNQLFKKKKITFSNTTKVFIPLRPNEPLMDYALIDDGVEYVISAKSGKATNTVKPKDIVALLQKRKDFSTLKGTKEYKLLEGLAGSSVLMGPIKAVSALYPELISSAAITSVNDKTKTFDESKFIKFIASNDYLKTKKSPTLNEIMYECEKLIVKETKEGDINLNDIFAKAIEKKVWYVKFEIGTDGAGDWDVIASDDIKSTKGYGRITLRSKNGYTRAADALGVQV